MKTEHWGFTGPSCPPRPTLRRDRSLQAQLDDPELAGAIEGFPIPLGTYGQAYQIAQWVVFMLSPAADFMTGSHVFIDGGTDALYRSDDWPATVPLTKLRRYLRITKEFNAAAARAAKG